MAKSKEKSVKIIQVQLTSDEHDILRAAAERLSVGTSTFMRMRALEAVRNET